MWNYVVINSGEEYGDFLAHSAKVTNNYQNKKKEYQKASDASKSDMITPEEYIKKMKLRRNAKHGVHE